MSAFTGKPLVGIPVSVSSENEFSAVRHVAGDKYVRTLAQMSGVMPMLIPALGELHDFDDIVGRIDGLALTGGKANIEPHHYDGPPFPDDEPRDPDRDATALPLVRACIDNGIPVFGICRGIQEINVALGGSLHYRIHELPGGMDHRMRREGTREERFAMRHPISLAPGGLLTELVGVGEVMVNSLHGQGIDRLADGLTVEALAPDGVIEAVRVTDAKAFAVGVQWHAEVDTESHALSSALFSAFGYAAEECARQKQSRARVR